MKEKSRKKDIHGKIKLNDNPFSSLGYSTVSIHELRSPLAGGGKAFMVLMDGHLLRMLL
jgi:hypothetical protein